MNQKDSSINKSIYSMTGFARVTQQNSVGHFQLELRSVNHRYLEFSFRLPEAFRSYELKLREQLMKSFSRGKIDITLVSLATCYPEKLKLNQGLLQTLKTTQNELAQFFPVESASFLDWLRYPGVVVTEENEEVKSAQFLHDLLQDAVEKMILTRCAEGESLRAFLLEKIAEPGQIIVLVESHLPILIENYKQKLEQKIKELSQNSDPVRLHQEIAYLVQRSDVSEEINRFKTHLKESEKVLCEGGVQGRRLDFLMQELMREASTLGAKSLDAEASHHIIQLKLVVEQMREQVQNIE